jgi:hypothetical protein
VTKRERDAAIVELLRCAADDVLKASWRPMPNLVDVARELDLYPFDTAADTRVVIAAWNRVGRVWNECQLTWDVALLEAAARLEESGK